MAVSPHGTVSEHTHTTFLLTHGVDQLTQAMYGYAAQTVSFMLGSGRCFGGYGVKELLTTLRATEDPPRVFLPCTVHCTTAA